MKATSDWQNLINQLSNGCYVDAVEAAKALSTHCHKDCVSSLLQFMKRERSAFRRELALHALVWMQNPQLTDTFIKLLRDTIAILSDS